jgi:acetolactate synthase-1/2/3 large subunit
MSDVVTHMKLTGGEVIARSLKANGIERIAAIPGHGDWVLLDALMQTDAEIPVIQVFHEQSAVHLADGYYRASGRPMAAMTSVGAGASNTILGLATAYADSTSLMLITGAPPTYMVGHGTMQEVDRAFPDDISSVIRPVVKKQHRAGSVAELPFAIHRLFNAMLTGRPGPVHLEVPMDVQAQSADVQVHDLALRLPIGVPHPDPEGISRAAALLRAAKRPVLAVGGGAITSGASDELVKLAERLGAGVVVTWNGKGAFPEDHPLFVGPVGQTGTIAANTVAAGADVVVSVGCRFTDTSASSYTAGRSFSFPPGKLIHIDLDPQEIGKNYPTEVGIVADATIALRALADELGDKAGAADRRAFLAEIEQHKREWEEMAAGRVNSDDFPLTSQRPLRDLRKVFPRDGIVVVGSGNTQGAVKQVFPVYEPRTHITSGGFSPMGWAVPAAIGAQIAQPDRKVACILGDGDFLMSPQELAVCAVNDLPVTFIVQNNAGYMSIRGGQRKIMDRHIASEFTRTNGSPYSPDFVAMAKSFGVEAFKPNSADELESTLKRAVDSDGPTLVEVPTSRDAAGPWVPGWWDFPIPDYIDDERQDEYRELLEAEQHL